MKDFPQKIFISGRVRSCLEFVKAEKLSGKKIVDIGSSFGWLEKELVKSKALLIGIEPNKEAVSFAQVNIGSGVEFKVGSALEIPLLNKTADMVLFFDVIEHLPKGSEKKALNEINRVLKKNGVLLLTTPNSHFLNNILDPAWYFGHRHYKKNKITNLLRRSGFKVLNYQIKGDIFSVIYVLWFYFNKWILKLKPKNGLLEKLDDKGYQKSSIATIFLKAKKED